MIGRWISRQDIEDWLECPLSIPYHSGVRNINRVLICSDSALTSLKLLLSRRSLIDIHNLRWNSCNHAILLDRKCGTERIVEIMKCEHAILSRVVPEKKYSIWIFQESRTLKESWEGYEKSQIFISRSR